MKKEKQYRLLFPACGSVIFFLLYLVATMQ